MNLLTVPLRPFLNPYLDEMGVSWPVVSVSAARGVSMSGVGGRTTMSGVQGRGVGGVQGRGVQLRLSLRIPDRRVNIQIALIFAVFVFCNTIFYNKVFKYFLNCNHPSPLPFTLLVKEEPHKKTFFSKISLQTHIKYQNCDTLKNGL